MLMDVAPQTTRELSIEGVPSPYVSDPIWVRGGKAIAFVDRPPQSEHGGRIWIVPAAGGLARPVTDASPPIFVMGGLDSESKQLRWLLIEIVISSLAFT